MLFLEMGFNSLVDEIQFSGRICIRCMPLIILHLCMRTCVCAQGKGQLGNIYMNTDLTCCLFFLSFQWTLIPWISPKRKYEKLFLPLFMLQLLKLSLRQTDRHTDRRTDGQTDRPISLSFFFFCQFVSAKKRRGPYKDDMDDDDADGG